jgi:hypothetical protein
VGSTVHPESCLDLVVHTESMGSLPSPRLGHSLYSHPAGAFYLTVATNYFLENYSYWKTVLMTTSNSYVAILKDFVNQRKISSYFCC